MSIYFWNRLPEAYQAVEYIQSSWTQWIDTGLNAWIWYRINMKIYTSSNSITDQTIIGWNNNTNTETIYCWLNYNSSYNSIYRWYNSQWFDANNTIAVWNTYEIESIIRNWTQKLTVNWTVKFTWSLSLSWTWTNHMSIFSRRWSNFALIKLYSMQIYNSSDTLIRDFVPCYRKSDNVIWLYDTANNQFYTNAWTWTFTKWSNVYPDKLKKLYRWDILIVWDPMPDPENHSYWTIQWYVDSGESLSVASWSYNQYTCALNISWDWKKLYCWRSWPIAPHEVTLNNWSLSWATTVNQSSFHPGWWWWPCEVVWNADGTVFYLSQNWSGSWTRAYQAQTQWSMTWWTQIQNIWKTICSRWRYLDTVNWEYAISMWPWRENNARLSTWKLWTAWDISSDFTLVSYNNIWNTGQWDWWVFFNADWTHMYLWNSINNVAHYKLSTPWDVSTCTLVEQYSRSDFWIGGNYGWWVVFYWTNMYVYANNTIKRFTVTYNQ